MLLESYAKIKPRQSKPIWANPSKMMQSKPKHRTKHHHIKQTWYVNICISMSKWSILARSYRWYRGRMYQAETFAQHVLCQRLLALFRALFLSYVQGMPLYNITNSSCTLVLPFVRWLVWMRCGNCSMSTNQHHQ